MYSAQDTNPQIISLLNNIPFKPKGDFWCTDANFLVEKLDSFKVVYKVCITDVLETTINNILSCFIKVYTELNYLTHSILCQTVHVFRPGFLLKTRSHNKDLVFKYSNIKFTNKRDA